ncbi:MAG TPA: outer membrane beta-barrel protein [Vicinamibacterales bacterium]|nr:outer membrane beta-barrel protein [Vicinamibacterales bacterium]
MRRAALVALAFVLLLPAASRAQVSVRGFGDFGFTVFNATQSFKAILGKSSGPVFGGGVEFGEKQFFLSLAAQRFRRDGHRVFVFEDQVFPLNVKDTITVTPIDLTFGYRLRSRGLVPYVGGGLTWYRYVETSEHATESEDLKETHAGYHLIGGAEVPLRRWLAAGVDAQWSAAPNAFGDSPTGVATVYDEHDLGGFTLRARIIVGR